VSEAHYRAGMAVDDLCRACKELRRHTVIAADTDGSILRVICDFCGSQHNYRGGTARWSPATARGEGMTSPSVEHEAPRRGALYAQKDALPLVSEAERSFPKMANEGRVDVDIEMVLRRIIREEAGLTPVAPAEKWRGGTVVLRPGKPGLQEKTLPIDSLFHKIVMVRNRLRVLEQQINSMEVAEDQKIKLQGYITGCYGSLTSFNVLFANEDDKFRGSGDE
jgi:hypothetical protein